MYSLFRFLNRNEWVLGIVVTTRMKKYFWHKYYEATGSFGRKKDGSRRNDKRTVQLSDEAEFWKFMALKKAGTY